MLGENPLRCAAELPSVLRERDVAATSINEGAAGCTLEDSDVATDRALGEVECCGRAMESAERSNRHEAAQRGDVQDGRHPATLSISIRDRW